MLTRILFYLSPGRKVINTITGYMVKGPPQHKKRAKWREKKNLERGEKWSS